MDSNEAKHESTEIESSSAATMVALPRHSERVESQADGNTIFGW